MIKTIRIKTDELDVKSTKIFSPAWEYRASFIRERFCPPVKPCMECGNPKIKGQPCYFCKNNKDGE